MGKKKSKRIGTKLRENNKKRVRQSQAKQRRQARQAKKMGLITHKAKQELRIPNCFPGKETLLKELEFKKLQKDKERLKNREDARKQAKKLANMAKNASKRANDFVAKEVVTAKEKMEAKSQDAESSRKLFFKALRNVIHEADVVVMVLDARDPNSCRCPELEQEIQSQGKKIILLLNKIDLIPKDAVTAWLTYLRKYHPTVAFKAARERGHVSHAKTSLENATEGLLKSAMNVIGADTLMQLLKNYARSGDRKTAISVGVVGYPNVGKSSVINSMKRSNATRVGATAGVTRHVQEVQLDSLVKLLDSPGVVFAGESEDPSVVMRNATKVETLKDPTNVCSALLTRAPAEAMMKHFQLPSYRDATDFLVMIAKARGKLKKKGIYDLPAAAKHVLSEWATGKIRYYCMPPKDMDAKPQIVTSFSAEFDIAALEANDLKELSNETDAVCMESGAQGTFQKETSEQMDCEEDSDESDDAMEEEDMEADGMDEDEPPMLIAESVQKKQRPENVTKADKKMFNCNNPQVNKEKKKAAKAAKKQSDDFDWSVL